VNRRLRKLELSELDHHQQALYQELTTGPRSRGPRPSGLTDEAGRLEGPFNAMLLSPVPGNALQALGAAVRYATSFPARSLELAILTVGYGWDSDFEVYAHEAIARAAGLTDEELTAVREGRPDDLSDPAERVLARTARALVTRSDLTDEEYQAARESLGEAGLFELTTLVGYYAALALQLRVFRVPVPDQDDLYRAVTGRSGGQPLCPFARWPKNAVTSFIQPCTSFPAPVGLDTIQITIRIPTIQPISLPTNGVPPIQPCTLRPARQRRRRRRHSSCPPS
jgi:4-carboxymuconolactone decarboxylase